MISYKYFPLVFLIYLLSSFSLANENDALIPYFEYSNQDIQRLEGEETEFVFTQDDLKKWDDLITDAFKEAPGSFTKFRLLTYLYVAQNDAAELSYHAKGQYTGSLDPLSHAVISLFLPEHKKPADFHEDGYSTALANIVVEKLRKRKEEEDARHGNYDVPEELKSDFFVGLSTAKWLPWYLLPSIVYWPSPSPDDTSFWDKQLQKLHDQQRALTEEKKQSVYLWAGMKDPKKSDWTEIANHYLFSQHLPLSKILQVRFVLMVGMYDALIASFQAKYHYMVLRPSMKDSTLHPLIPVPNHPSYPSNHSIASTLAATILSYFFPAQTSHWNALANEAGLSRIWGGIHYPVDDEEGRKAGKEIADDLLEQVFHQPH